MTLLNKLKHWIQLTFKIQLNDTHGAANNDIKPTSEKKIEKGIKVADHDRLTITVSYSKK